ncbi:tail tape measure protein [Microcystis phage MinS1]|nr:tail tape measure protein [Microcystis phage MinS1]
MAEARSVVVRLSMEAAQYIREAQKVGKLTEDAMSKAERATQRQAQALDTIERGSGRMALALTAGLVASGKAAIDWESQFAGVEKTVDGTAQQMAALEAELRGLATSMPATHQEIAATAEAAGQLGVAREDVADFTKTMVQLGETTNLTADQAATDIAQMANVMGTAPEEIERVGAALVALGNDGASTEAQILGMAQRIAGAGAQIGLTEADILGIANAAASMGIEVEAGGTAVSRVFTDMAKAVSQGGEDLDAFAKVAGLTNEEFSRLFAQDPAQAFAAFTTGLNDIKEAGGDVFTTLDQLGLSDVRVSQALLGMAASGDLLTDSLQLGADAFAENSALAEEYAKRADTTAAQTQVAWNQIRDAGIDAGATLLPVVAELANGVATVTGAFRELPDPVQASLTKLLAVGALVSGGTWLGIKAVRGVSELRDAVVDLGLAGGRTGTSLGRMATRAAGIAAVAGSVSILGNELGKALGAVVDAQDVDAQLENILVGGDPALLGRISDDIAKVGSTSGAAVEPIKELATGFGLFANTDLDNSAQNIELVDQAMAAMVESGRIREATELFNQFVAEAEGMSVIDGVAPSIGNELFDKYAGNFDAYALALDNAKGSAEAAGPANEEYAASAESSGQSAADAAAEVSSLARAMRDQVSAALGAFDATTRYGEAVAAAREQAKTGEKGLNAMTEAGRNNRNALSGLAATWNEQPKAVKNSQQAYEGARRTFINFAMQMGVGRQRARELANSLLEVPRRVVSEARVDDKQAQGAIRDTNSDLVALDRYKATPKITVSSNAGQAASSTRSTLSGIADENVYINVIRRLTTGQQTGDGAGGLTREAMGGMYRGNVKVYASGGLDRPDGHQPELYRGTTIRMWGEPETKGEAYIPLADDYRRPRARKILEMTADELGGEVEWYARGGRRGRRGDGENKRSLVAQTYAATIVNGFARDLEYLSTTAANAAIELKVMKGTLKEEREARKKLISQQKEYQQSVAGQFNNDLFGNGLEGLRVQLEADRNDSNTMRQLLQQLAGKGLDTEGGLFAALSQSGDITTARQLLATGRSGIDQYEALFGQRARAQQQLGAFAAQEKFGDSVAQFDRVIGRLERQIDKIGDRVEKGAEKGAERGSERGSEKGTNKGARDGIQGRAASTNTRRKLGGK